MHVDFGRQAVQGFLSRVNRRDDIDDIPSENGSEMLVQNLSKLPAENVITDNEASEGEDVGSQIIRQIDLYRDIFDAGFTEKELSVKLSPEDLGSVEVRIKRSDSGFEISFTAQKADAAELIADKAADLEKAMASRGIELKEISVSRQIVTNEADGGMTDSAFGSGGSDLYGGANNGQNGSERHFTFGGNPESDLSDRDSDSSSDSNFNREAKLWVSA
jgi:hypothetical protein